MRTAFIAAFTLLTFAAGAAEPATAAKRYGTWGIDLEGMDRTVKPGDDFFRFVNGKWAAEERVRIW